jgi:hypothetical protein
MELNIILSEVSEVQRPKAVFSHMWNIVLKKYKQYYEK